MNAVRRLIAVTLAVLVGGLVFGNVLAPVATAAPEIAGESSAACPNEQLRAEQPYGLELPDCRAYEMVLPVETAGNNAVNPPGSNVGSSSRAAVSGEGLVFQSLGAFAGSKSSRFNNEYLATRGREGWSTRSLAPPYEVDAIDTFAPYEGMFFTPELSEGVAETALPNPGGPALFNSYLVDLADGAYRPLSDSLEGSESSLENVVVGASTDLSHVVVNNVESIDGRVVEVTVNNNGEPMSGASVGAGPTYRRDAWHAVSANGSRIFFTSEGQLYVRMNVEQPQSPMEGGRCAVPADACTVAVSASQRTPEDPAGPQLARYWGASADGSKVFFVSSAELTNDAYTGAADNADNLYEYDLESGRLTDLSVDDTDADGAAVQGVVQISEEGTYVYFVADGALRGEGQPGMPNLYVSHEGGAPRLIATLVPGGTRYVNGGGQVEGDAEDWEEEGTSGPPEFHTAAVSPDGTRLAFVSQRSQTGYDNEPVEPNECEDVKQKEGQVGELVPGPCKEVDLYDAVSNSLVCVSCNPSGARPICPSASQLVA